LQHSTLFPYTTLFRSEMTPFLEQAPQSHDDRVRLRTLAVRYSHTLWRHVDAENSVLYPEGVERLRRYGVRELPDRPMSEVEATRSEERRGGQACSARR